MTPECESSYRNGGVTVIRAVTVMTVWLWLWLYTTFH